MVLGVIVFAAAPAAAQDVKDQEARVRFQSATLAYADGRFEEALHDFRRAYELSGRAALLFNIASAAERLRLDVEARDAYEAYLEKVPDAENRRFVESRIEILRKQIAEDEARAAADAAREQENATKVSASAGDEAQRDERRPVVKRWWFWTVIGVAVAGGVTAGVMLSGRDTAEPFVGDDGMTHHALTVARW
jgi:tetratricopeptide (TPR) repeat protein